MQGLDFIFNGNASGDVATKLLSGDLDADVLRPWLSRVDGKSYITVNSKRRSKENPKKFERENILTNENALLPKESWIELDTEILETMKAELTVWNDIVGSGLTYDLPNAFDLSTLQGQTVTDSGRAGLSMDVLEDTNNDRVLFNLASTPLPVVHSDFQITLRELRQAQKGWPLDTGGVANATRRCIELIEQLTLGTLGTYQYGGGTIYGFRNFPYRLTKALTLPTDPNWSPDLHIDEVLAQIQSMSDIFFRGPYFLYYSSGWKKFLENDYSKAYNGDTLMTRLKKITDIKNIKIVDYLPNYENILWQPDRRVVQAIRGMKLKTLQWDGKGGLIKYYKVMGIMVPRFRANSNQTTGINHGVAA